MYRNPNKKQRQERTELLFKVWWNRYVQRMAFWNTIILGSLVLSIITVSLIFIYVIPSIYFKNTNISDYILYLKSFIHMKSVMYINSIPFDKSFVVSQTKPVFYFRTFFFVILSIISFFIYFLLANKYFRGLIERGTKDIHRSIFIRGTRILSMKQLFGFQREKKVEGYFLSLAFSEETLDDFEDDYIDNESFLHSLFKKKEVY